MRLVWAYNKRVHIRKAETKKEMVGPSQGSNISISRTCILKSSLEKFCLTRSLASLFDSSKSLVHIRIAPFLPQEITIINYSTLHQKQTLSIHIYPLGIDTNLITYPIDTCQRQRLIPMLSHIPHRQTQAPHPHIHAYTLCHLQKKNTKY